MPKLKLVAEPTFKALVDIPIAGAPPAPVEFIFRHRTKAELGTFLDAMKERAAAPGSTSEVDTVMDMVCGWDLDDEFTRENVEKLLQSYHQAGSAIGTRYPEVLMLGKQGN